MKDFVTLQQMVLAAHEKLDPAVWEFVVGAAGSGATARRNRHALESLAFDADIYRDVSRIDLSTRLLGAELAMPIVLAPMGSIGLVDPQAGAAAARAAEQAGVMSFLSGVADPGIEAVCAASKAPVVFTLYVQGDQRWLDETLDRLAVLPLAGIAVLADTPYYSRRDHDLMNQPNTKVNRRRLYSEVLRDVRQGVASAPEKLDSAFYAAKVTWEMLEYVKRRTDLPVIAKGIMSADCATRAVDHGADVIYVSNHGGRQLDYQPGTVAVLPEVVAALGEHTKVVVDGGCLRGTDVLKCLALGADAVGIGRVQALALGAGGSEVLARALQLLEEELTVDMGLLGVTRIQELTPERLRSAPVVGALDVLGSYPMVMNALK